MGYRPGDYAKPMTAERGFDESVDFVIDVLEGGDCIVEDSGGITKFGISQKAHPTINVSTLTRADAIEIYREQYWKPAGCEMLRWPFCLVVFDTAVNHGVAKAVEMRLKAYNWAELLMERVVRYKFLRDTQPDKSKYLNGWIDRCILLYHKAKG
jgi:lysozyme family protein